MTQSHTSSSMLRTLETGMMSSASLDDLISLRSNESTIFDPTETSSESVVLLHDDEEEQETSAPPPAPLTKEEVEAAKQLRVDKIVHAYRAYMTCQLLKSDCFPVEVVENLFIGSIGAAYSNVELHRAGIRYILSVGSGISPRYPNEFHYYVCEMLDAEDFDLIPFLEPCHDFITKALLDSSDPSVDLVPHSPDTHISPMMSPPQPRSSRGKGILVHCFAGRSRSAAIVISYLMRFNKWSYQKAFEYVNSRRPIQPNSGFVRQLKEYEKKLFGSVQVEKDSQQGSHVQREMKAREQFHTPIQTQTKATTVPQSRTITGTLAGNGNSSSSISIPRSAPLHIRQ